MSPFAAIYWVLTSFRNWLYAKNIFKSTEFDLPIISIGNLAVGGSGKTPMVEYLIKHLKTDFTIAVLSRGYGRKSVGFKWVEAEHHFNDTGDEPLQIKLKFPDVAVAVCEKRVDGVIQILADKPEVTLIILDDAFQHRAIKPSLQLLLSTYHKPFYQDWIMPVGRLRERRAEAKRANAIVFTKKPQSQLPLHVPSRYNQPIFYTGMGNELLTTEKDNSIQVIEKPLYGFSALADNSLFENSLKETYNLVGFSGFRDHYSFTQNDIDLLHKKAGSADLVCTEKDWIKVKELNNVKDILVIKSTLVPQSTDFIEWIKNQIN